MIRAGGDRYPVTRIALWGEVSFHQSRHEFFQNRFAIQFDQCCALHAARSGTRPRAATEFLRTPWPELFRIPRTDSSAAASVKRRRTTEDRTEKRYSVAPARR